MSIKTFLSKFKAEWKKLFAEAPTVLNSAANFVTYATPFVVLIAGLISPAAAPLTAAALATVKTDLVTLSAACQSEATAATAQQAIQNLQTSLPSLLSAAKVENVSEVSKIEGIVGTVGAELSELLADFMPPKPAVAAA